MPAVTKLAIVLGAVLGLVAVDLLTQKALRDNLGEIEDTWAARHPEQAELLQQPEAREHLANHFGHMTPLDRAALVPPFYLIGAGIGAAVGYAVTRPGGRARDEAARGAATDRP